MRLSKQREDKADAQRPQGEKRPADVIGNAIKIARIATGEETDDVDDDGKDKAAVSLESGAGRRVLRR